MDIKIKIADKSMVKKLIDLLNLVTINLHDKGINQWEYPWSSEKIEEDLKVITHMYKCFKYD